MHDVPVLGADGTFQFERLSIQRGIGADEVIQLLLFLITQIKGENPGIVIDVTAVANADDDGCYRWSVQYPAGGDL